MTLPLAVRALLMLALVSAAPGCQTFRYATPAGFVVLKDQRDYDYRAVNAEGVVLAMREIRHEPRGDLDFWTRSVEKEVRLLGGYALIGKDEVTTARGLAGRRLRFGHDEGQAPHLYFVTLFVTERKIYLLEAGGSKAELAKVDRQVDDAVRAFTVK